MDLLFFFFYNMYHIEEHLHVIYTHYTSLYHTAVCETSKTTGVPNLAEPSYPIVLEWNKISQPSAPTSSQATTPCKLLGLKLNSQVWPCCESLWSSRQNDNAPVYVFINRRNVNIKQGKCNLWDSVTALYAKTSTQSNGFWCQQENCAYLGFCKLHNTYE